MQQPGGYEIRPDKEGVATGGIYGRGDPMIGVASDGKGVGPMMLQLMRDPRFMQIMQEYVASQKAGQQQQGGGLPGIGGMMPGMGGGGGGGMPGMPGMPGMGGGGGGGGMPGMGGGGMLPGMG